MMSMFRLCIARANCVTPSPPLASLALTWNTPALSLYSATGRPCCSRYSRVAVKYEKADSDSQKSSSIRALVASSTKTSAVQRGPRSSNHS